MCTARIIKNIYIISFSMLLAGLLCSCKLMPDEEQAVALPLIKAAKTEYETYKVVKKEIRKTVRGTASFIAETEKSQYFKQTGGRIKEINVKIGQQVKKGDVLLRLECGNLESRILIQQNNVERLRIQLEADKEDYEKLKSIGSEHISQKELKDMQKNIKLLEIDYQNAQLALVDLRKELTESTLYAPFDGIVTFLESLKEGDIVNEYKPIITVSDSKKMQLYLQTDSADDIKPGMTVKAGDYEGVVLIAPSNVPKEASDRYKNGVLISVKNLPEGFKWGDTMEVSIDVETKRDVLAIPAKGIRKLMNSSYAYILEGGTKKEVNVETGVETPLEIEIISGLKEGQTVILN